MSDYPNFSALADVAAEDGRTWHPSRNGHGPALLEMGGDELVASDLSMDDLAYLPMLGASGYFVLDWSHLVSGYPRVGKTELLVALTREWLGEGHEVLYITEEPAAMWGSRLAGASGDWKGLRVVFGLGADVDALLRRAFRGDEAIVIVDSLRNLLQLQDEKDNSEIARAVTPWIADARQRDKTLVMAHHQRKGGGENGEGIAGGHAMLGSFDIALEVLRDPSQAKNRRLIRTYARLIESREAIYEMEQPNLQPIQPSVGGCRFVLLGDPKSLRLDEVVNRLLGSMTAEFQTTKELHDGLDDPRPSLEQVRQALTKLAKEGRIRRQPPVSAGEQKGKTYTWASTTSNGTI